MQKSSKNKNQKFIQTEKYEPKNEKEKRLCEVFLKLNSKVDSANFLRDLLTPAEIEEFSNRLEIARLLVAGESYLRIGKLVGVSTTTVSRTAHWFFRGCGGYAKIFNLKF